MMLLPAEKLKFRRRVNLRKNKIMGDKSPKANQKKSSQKQSKAGAASAEEKRSRCRHIRRPRKSNHSLLAVSPDAKNRRNRFLPKTSPVRIFLPMKLCQGQVWKKGKEYIRIVRLERLEVEYKSMPNLGNKEGTKHVTSKKDFCRLLKGAHLLARAKMPTGVEIAPPDLAA